MILLARAKNGKMIKVGKDVKDSNWYFMSEEIASFVNGVGTDGNFLNFQLGDSVIISTENRNGERYISSIKKGSDINVADSGDSTEDKSQIKSGAKKDERVMYKAICSTCGKECEVPFKPNNDKPITCKSCFTASRSSNRAPEVNESIKRQAIGHMTSRTIAGLGINKDEVEEVARKLYALYQELVG